MTQLDLETALIHRIGEFSRRADRAVERAIAPMGLTRLKWQLLFVMERDGLDQPSPLAEAIGLDRAIISRLIASLEKGGLITVLQLASDKRQRRIMLTEQGRRALHEASEAITQVTAEQFAPLRPRQQLRLLQFLDALTPRDLDEVPANAE
ncbi:MarR family winged helix-turn-helix transcriptional regulator [Pontivivens insulae]|uniref:Transcriptional regulator SlyA n=1 Tax=Pontivivens insulae TaxID=1639689 RepID=A0A2R8AFP1_9RHOB|nr:MarR family transcriptional regulator [Pontivivens insulae]RED12305.1 DNA-binding MarR family transcriptional regulator [Pontivivens insulae]SPF31062.1 Transcriptional regulator SlyA [Pontivivens insulae]